MKKNAPAVQIGATKETVTESKKAILEILKSGAEQETIRYALGVLRDSSSIGDVSISHCHIGDKT